MKDPFTTKIFPWFTLGAGGLGLSLRVWLFATGVDAKGLFVASHPGGILSFLLTALVMLALFLAVRKPGPVVKPLPALFRAAGCAVAGAGILLASLGEFSLGDPISSVAALAGIAAAGCLVWMGLQISGDQKPAWWLYAAVAAYLMLHPVSQYRTWSSMPQVQVYFFPLLASVMLMLTAYHRAALEAGEGNDRWYLFVSQAALFFCCLCLNTSLWLFYLAMGIWVATMPLPQKKSTPKTAIPSAPLECIRLLEQQGYRAYLVGGCVRDRLLGKTPQDYDLCTNATPEQICQAFEGFELVRNGEKHGTIGVVMDGSLYEITTFRSEGSYSDSRHPDWVEFVPTVEEDLARRDFTINAMAYHPKTGYVDPWGGRRDLENKRLRAVGDPNIRFREDALRILRGVRFAVRFRLTCGEHTQAAMFELAPLMDNLAKERVFDELCKLLPLLTPEDMIQYAPVLTQVIPALGPMVDFDQRSPHHKYDLYTHTAHVVAAVPGDLALRWAALLHDIGKVPTFTTDDTGRGHYYGHAQVSAEMAQQVLTELKAPTALRERVDFLIRHHMTPLEPNKPLLRRYMGKFGDEALTQLLALQEADFGSKGTGTEEEAEVFPRIKELLEQIRQEEACLKISDLAISGNDLMAMGYAPGPRFGQCLEHLLQQVQQEVLPNEKQALLSAAAEYMDA